MLRVRRNFRRLRMQEHITGSGRGYRMHTWKLPDEHFRSYADVAGELGIPQQSIEAAAGHAPPGKESIAHKCVTWMDDHE